MKKFLIPIFWILGFLIILVTIIIARAGHTFGKTSLAILIFLAFTFFLIGIFLNVIRNKIKFNKSQFIIRILLIAYAFGYNVFDLIKHVK